MRRIEAVALGGGTAPAPCADKPVGGPSGNKATALNSIMGGNTPREARELPRLCVYGIAPASGVRGNIWPAHPIRHRKARTTSLAGRRAGGSEVKLEVGKSYISRNGLGEVLITDFQPEHPLPYFGNDCCGYTANGRHDPESESEWDLVALVTDDPAPEVIE